MKKIILILSLVILVGCKSKKTVADQSDINKEEVIENTEEAKLLKLDLLEVNNFKKERAYELGKRILMTCNTSKFKPFTQNEATASVINNITLEKLSKTCTKYRQWYGTFIDLKLIEIYENVDNKTFVFRFKALYTKKVANKELRVFMNDENKISAIKTLDWVDAYGK